MSPEIFIAFVAACWLLAWTPGPTLSLIFANVASYGLAAGLWTLAGNVVGLSVLVTLAALGMSSLMSFVSEWFDWLRWIGAIYLVWLGLQRLRGAWCGEPTNFGARPASGRRWFGQAVTVCLSNPKVLLFLGAFLPQFVDTGAPVVPQLWVLGVTFVAVISIADLLSTVVFARVRGVFAARRMRLMDGMAGGLLLLGGLALAAARRP
ncbi:MAG TPA: LysE family translocator [Hyphomicrobiaceae bacterium]|nr:LysE family translocator [Hyphomicrobiaceae bacterium]